MPAANQALTVVIPARANSPNLIYLGWYAKHPQDTVLYSIDATGFLHYAGRTIIGIPSVTTNSTDITISQISAGGGQTTFLASGGQDVHTYGVTWSAQLDDGTSITRTLWLPILSLFPAMQDAVLVAKGDPGTGLTSGAGAPIAGSGTSGQGYIDLTGGALWLNNLGTWYQVGLLGAPNAAPIPPNGIVPNILASGGITLTTGGEVLTF